MIAPVAHVAGVPVEETVGMYGPVLLLVAGAASAKIGIRYRNLRARRVEARARKVNWP
jgi:hypothetical protein